MVLSPPSGDGSGGAAPAAAGDAATRPPADDPYQEAIKAKGAPWEDKILRNLRAGGSNVLDLTEVTRLPSCEDRCRRTREALLTLRSTLAPGQTCWVYQPCFCGCIECLPGLYAPDSAAAPPGRDAAGALGRGGPSQPSSLASTIPDHPFSLGGGDVQMPARGGVSEGASGGGGGGDVPMLSRTVSASSDGSGDAGSLQPPARWGVGGEQEAGGAGVADKGQLKRRLRCGEYRPDFLVVRCQAAGSSSGSRGGAAQPAEELSVDIVDAKCSMSVKLSHRMQVAFYAHLLEREFEQLNADQPDERRRFVVRRGGVLIPPPALLHASAAADAVQPAYLDDLSQYLLLVRATLSKLRRMAKRIGEVAPNGQSWLLAPTCRCCEYRSACEQVSVIVPLSSNCAPSCAPAPMCVTAARHRCLLRTHRTRRGGAC